MTEEEEEGRRGGEEGIQLKIFEYMNIQVADQMEFE